MADNADDDLVARIALEGVDATLADLRRLGAESESAFERFGLAAKYANTLLTRSTFTLASRIDALKKSFPKEGDFGSFKQVTDDFNKAGAAAGRTGVAFGLFARRAVATFALVVGGSVGLVRAVGNVARAYDDAGKDTNDNVKAQTDLIQSQNAAAKTAREYRNNLANLGAQLNRGEIDYTAYSAAMAKTTKDYQDANRETAIAENEQRALEETTKRLQRAAAQNKVFDDLAQKVGGPLAGSMISAGRAAQSFEQSILGAVSGPLAGALEKIVSLFEKNRPAIIKFFDDIGKKIREFTNDGSLEATFSGAVAAIQGAATVINAVFVPVIAGILKAFDGLAAGINAVFGTKITGGALALTAVFVGMTRSLRLFTGVIAIVIRGSRGLVGAFLFITKAAGALPLVLNVAALAIRGFLIALGPVGLAITAVSILIGVLYARGYTLTGMWKAIQKGGANASANIQKAWAGVTGFFSRIWNAISGAGVAVWGLITSAASSGWNGIVAIWQGAVAYFANIWSQITMAGTFVWQAIQTKAANTWLAITTLWGTITGFFATVWAGITAGGTIVWDAITGAAAAAWQMIKDGATSLWAFITETFDAGIALLSGAWEGIKNGAAAAWEYIKQVFNDGVAFVQGIPAQIIAAFGVLAESVKNTFNSVLETVTGFFRDLLTKATTYLQPVINFLKTIVSLLGFADGGIAKAGGGAAGKYAGGGAVFGAGTATSDSIPAWLSNGEFVIKAKMVAKYGRQFFEMLNSGRFKAPKFNTGGLVANMPSFKAPRFANGGAVGSSHIVNLSIDGQQFGGMKATPDVARDLKNYAIKRQVLRAGRNPSSVT